MGYGYLVEKLKLSVSGYRLTAKVDSAVLAVREHGTTLLVPTAVEPRDDDLLTHLEFALKYQGVELEVLQAVCLVLEAGVIQARLDATPNGKYIRTIAALYEAFTGKTLQANSTSAPYVNLFDPKAYVCGVSRRQPKFRVNLNGIGDLNFCPVIRRTSALGALLARDIFADLDAFVESIGGEQHLERALGWAYLDETRGSFAIEHEAPSEDKARRFVQVLKGAHEGRALSEEYLCELQRDTITNPYLAAFSFRHEQNWLQQGGRLRASSISYLPPPVSEVEPLMKALMDFANGEPSIDPLLKAFLVSFAFVFIHPFMDGNGRLSRFLVHHALCRSGKLDQGLILPISVAMLHDESGYLSALQSVSKPIRALWDVMIVDHDHIDARFKGDGDPYRYWDATACMEFGIRMTHYALDTSLIKESDYLRGFDTVFARINTQYDIQDKDLHALIRMAHSHGGKISQNRRKQYRDRVQPAVLDAIEAQVQAIFFDQG
ncbi:cell division protein Fic [Advenella kashmirensis W13003]|uniref:Cell division protein Fic n=1 Tax=Advenella kashmirensis W13003 TaxID=1424334 RepID=V8QYR2_9BURK|nr:cell division protein Fic [Advenella kashmirensis W13003]